MMKKLRVISLAMFFLMAMTFFACADSETIDSASSNVVSVSLTSVLPETAATRSFGDGTTATVLDYAVYKIDADDSSKLTLISIVKDAASIENKYGSISFDLVSGYNYKVALFARATSGPYDVTFDTDAATVVMPYSDSNNVVTANDETWDFFYTVYTTGVVTSAIQETVPLYRPMAQLNLGVTGLKSEAVKALFENDYSSLTVSVTLPAGLPTQLDLFTDKATTATTKDITISYTGDPTILECGDFPVEADTYDYLYMTYVLPGVTEESEEVATTTQTLSSIEISINHDTMESSGVFTQPSVPLKRNYRTNIYGSLLSSAAMGDEQQCRLDLTVSSDWGSLANSDISTEQVSSYTDGTYILTISGYTNDIAYVSMGEGLNFAAYNMGASSPEETGDYFRWGALAPVYQTSSKSYSSNTTDYYDGTTSIQGDADYDVATAEWGSEWVIPTQSQWALLFGESIKREWITYNGVSGYLFTSTASGYEGNTLFLPAAGWYYSGLKDATYGRYWSSTYYGYNYSYELYFTDEDLDQSNFSNKSFGLCVRPILAE